MKLGDVIPDFKAETDRGVFDSFYNWVGEGKWSMIFSHPADFTPVCTTELARLSILAPEFERRNVRIIAISIDSAETHRAWAADINSFAACSKRGNMNELPYEIIADTDRSICTELGMIDPDEVNCAGVALSARAVLLIGPDHRLKSKILYPATCGRSFDEILRMVDGVQLGARLPVATPVDWQPGAPVIAQPNLSTRDVIEQLCKGDEDKCTVVQFPSGKEYMRFVDPSTLQ